jgi:hypothetical protein
MRHFSRVFPSVQHYSQHSLHCPKSSSHFRSFTISPITTYPRSRLIPEAQITTQNPQNYQHTPLQQETDLDSTNRQQLHYEVSGPL